MQGLRRGEAELEQLLEQTDDALYESMPRRRPQWSTRRPPVGLGQAAVLRRRRAPLRQSAPQARAGPAQSAAAIDIDRAVRLNRQYRQSLGWQAYSGRIARLIGLTTSASSEQAFAVAVAHWQQRQSGLAVDGIIGPS